MSDLLFCPFCGGEASIEKCWNFDDESPSGYFVWCHGNDCVVEPMTEDFKEEAEAIAAWNSRADYHGYEQAAIEAWESVKAWNSRAERTCEFSIKDNMNETEGMGDVWIECSACHCVFDFYADEWLMKMSYCPNCGARRVVE